MEETTLRPSGTSSCRILHFSHEKKAVFLLLLRPASFLLLVFCFRTVFLANDNVYFIEVFFVFFFVLYTKVWSTAYVLLGGRHEITLLHIIFCILLVARRAILEIFLAMFF